jgi:hypothetical protein
MAQIWQTAESSMSAPDPSQSFPAVPVARKADVVPLSSEGAREAGVAKLSLRQSSLAQAAKQMLDILGALEER